MAVLGIDYGSSFTTISWINPRCGKPETIKFNGDQSVKCPSVILGTKSGLILGFHALSYMEDASRLPLNEKMEVLADFIPSLKRILDTNASEYIGNKSYTHYQLLTEFFKFVKTQANDDCGSNVIFDSVVISHPVDFEISNISLLKDALSACGFTSVNTKLEPIAAVQGYDIDHPLDEGQGILVFDFGGGTIDVAYVKKQHGELNLLCEPRGDRNCGGQDIDLLLYKDLCKNIMSKYQFDISPSCVDYNLLNSCRRLKEHFSGSNNQYETPIVFVHEGKIISYKYQLSRDAFNNIISPKVSDAINVAKSVVDQVKLNNQSIDKVLLIGGSSQLTLVREMLSQLLPEIAIDTCGEKDVAVALGNIVSKTMVVHENGDVGKDSSPQNSHDVSINSNNVKKDRENSGILLFNWGED